MKHAHPRGLSSRRVKQLLSKVKSFRSAGSRIEALSRQFLGQPYTIDPLIGSVEKPEVFTASLDGLDCVTYIETVLALSRSSTVDEFIESLREIRYEDGCVAWERRNHYMTGWIRNNTRAGLVRRVSPKSGPAITRVRVLNALPGLAPMRVRFECVPKASLRKMIKHVKMGDLIFFASTRQYHDVFHCGIIVRDGDRLLLRHASRSQGGVVEQELEQFLKANRMAGVILVRPVERVS